MSEKAPLSWRVRNGTRKFLTRLRYPWPIYKRQGGISNITVIRADGTEEDYGYAAVVYAKRWKASSR